MMNTSRHRELSSSHTSMARAGAYLETSFWAEESVSDDEGIGSDDSVTSDQRGATPGARHCICDTRDQAGVTRQTQVKTPLRVTKFLKVLKQSVKRDHHPSNVGDKSSPRTQRQLLNNLVFGADLCQHLSTSQKSVPNVVSWCTNIIEQRLTTDIRSLEGVFRLSGQSSQIKALRLSFDAGVTPDWGGMESPNIHSVGSLLKLYFRELPAPLLTYGLYSSFVRAVRAEAGRRHGLIRQTVRRLDQGSYSTLAHLMRHLHLLAQSASITGMTSRNLALVWAPNLLRSEQPQHSLVSEENLRDIGVQARCIEFLISQYEELFLTPRDFPLASPANLPLSSSAVDFNLGPPRHASTPFKSSTSVEFNLNGPPEPYQRSFYGSFNNLRLSSRLLPSRYQDERSLRSLQPEMIQSSCVKSSSNNGGQARVNIPSHQEPHHEVKHLPKAMSTSTMMIGSVSNVSAMPDPFKTSLPSPSMSSYYKSLPALDKQHADQLDKELRHLSESVDILYEQEDSEIEFLDTFIDYDDISVHDNGSLGRNRASRRQKSRHGLPPIIPSENVSNSRKDKLRDGLRWLTFKGKLSLKQFGSRDNLKTREGKERRPEKKFNLSEVRSYNELRHRRA